MHVPDFIDIAEDTQKAAQAAMNRSFVLTPPEDAVVSVAKNGDEYKRWVEGGVIEDTWREGTASGLVVAVAQVKIRSGYPNQHERVWARHMLHPKVLLGQGNEQEKKSYEGMNNRSINAITTLLQATGYAPTSGGLSKRLLEMMFPIKNQPGAKAPVVGKSVMLNLVDQPNRGEKARSPRQTTVDSYLPDVVEA